MSPEPDRPRGRLPLGALELPIDGRTAIRAALVVVFVAAGIVGSLVGAHAIADKDASVARHTFAAGATSVATTLRLGIDQSRDVGASTFVEAHPQASQSTIGTRATPSGTRTIPSSTRTAPLATPIGTRTIPSSTSTALAGTSTTSLAALAGTRTISSSTRAAPLAAPLDMHVGRASYRSVIVARRPALEFKLPLYERNASLVGAPARKSVLVGWFRGVVSPQRWLDAALTGHPGYSARLRYRTARASILFTAGVSHPGSSTLQSAAAGLQHGWSARIVGPAPTESVFSDGDALALLIVGIFASLLAGGLVIAGTAEHEKAVVTQPPPTPPPTPRQELYDPLTGLPNRLLMTELAERMLTRTGRQSGMLAGALLIDVDWFKDVNDKLGPAAGEQVLRTVAQRLPSAVRTGDVVGRLERDRFVVLVECQARGVRLESLAGRMIEMLREPVTLEGFGPSFCVTVSIGIAFGRYTDCEQLLGDAQLALETSKAAGKDRFTLFNASMRSLIEDRGVLEAEMHAALSESQFFLLYEPVFDLASRGAVGFEALIRWRHPARGVMLAEDFLPMAEDTGLTVPIGRWALEEACTQAAAWNVSGNRASIAVAVSPHQLHRDGFVTDVRRALQQSGIEPSLLILQVDEATVMGDIAGAAERLGEVKRLGVRVAINDFGAGYAYRSDLQRLPLDYLKVDRGSLAASDDEDYRSWLLEAILLFARDLSLTVIARGVTTEEQLESLTRLGCTLAQGPLLGAPVSADGAVRLFKPQPLPTPSTTAPDPA